MPVTDKNSILVAVHCYFGDKQQVLDLLPVFEHHGSPIVIMSPTDSQVHGIGPHICRSSGLVGYTGQVTWDRQRLQLETLLQYPQQWFLLNDADSFCITPELPEYLFDDQNCVWSNEVTDFRVPGESWQGLPPWPMDYHKGFPLIAMQPPYFLHRKALTKIVDHSRGLVACPTTPFIDWWWIPAVYAAHVKHKRYYGCASCETTTDLGKRVMQECIIKRNATFLHAIKTKESLEMCLNAYRSTR